MGDYGPDPYKMHAQGLELCDECFGDPLPAVCDTCGAVCAWKDEDDPCPVIFVVGAGRVPVKWLDDHQDVRLLADVSGCEPGPCDGRMQVPDCQSCDGEGYVQCEPYGI